MTYDPNYKYTVEDIWKLHPPHRIAPEKLRELLGGGKTLHQILRSQFPIEDRVWIFCHLAPKSLRLALVDRSITRNVQRALSKPKYQDKSWFPLFAEWAETWVNDKNRALKLSEEVFGEMTGWGKVWTVADDAVWAALDRSRSEDGYEERVVENGSFETLEYEMPARRRNSKQISDAKELLAEYEKGL